MVGVCCSYSELVSILLLGLNAVGDVTLGFEPIGQLLDFVSAAEGEGVCRKHCLIIGEVLGFGVSLRG